MRIVRPAWLAAAGCLLSPPAGAMQLAVNTHFDQGWAVGLLGRVAEIRAQGIRDTVPWGKVERTPGLYAFDRKNSGFMDDACRASVPVLLDVQPRNPIYDGGATIYTAKARRAFAAYVRTLADRYPCIVAFAMGNEINGTALTGPILAGMPGSYLAILGDVRSALKPTHPNVALLSGSSLAVATGFFERLFAAGMLPLVDGIAIHPYRNIPEQLPIEIDRLKAAMIRNGGEKPIWATEFGFAYATPDDAPPHALKLVTLLSAAHVARADWYALIEEKWFPNMGLYQGQVAKPALDMFELAAQRLLPAGNARRIDAGDPQTFIYRYGDGPYVMWGGGRAITFTGDVATFDARGRPIAPPATLGPDPIVVGAPAAYVLGPPPVLADTMLGYGTAPWNESVLKPAGAIQPMQWIDTKSTSYVGIAGLGNFRAMASAVWVAGSGPKRPSLIEHYTSPVAAQVRISACFAPTGTAQVNVRIAHGGTELYAGQPRGDAPVPPIDIALAAGDSVDFTYTSLATGGKNELRRRVRILATADPAPALCPPGVKD